MLNLSKNDNLAIENFVTQVLQLQLTMKFHLQEVQDHCKATAKKLKKVILSFQVGNIKRMAAKVHADIVVSSSI